MAATAVQFRRFQGGGGGAMLNMSELLEGVGRAPAA